MTYMSSTLITRVQYLVASILHDGGLCLETEVFFNFRRMHSSINLQGISHYL